MTRLWDWSDFKKRVEEILDTGSVDKMTASTCRTLLGKGDSNVKAQNKVTSAIKIMLEDSEFFPEEWRKQMEKERREWEEFLKIACEICEDNLRVENSLHCQSCIDEMREEEEEEGEEGEEEEEFSGYECGICGLKMQKRTLQICSECLIDRGGSGADPNLDSHFHKYGDLIVKFDDDED